MVLSEENLPALAMFRMEAFSYQLSSRYFRSTSSWALQ